MSVALSAGRAAPRPGLAAGLVQHRALWFTAAILAVSFTLQRFGIPAGDKQLNIVGPLGLAFAAVGLATGTLVVHRRRMVAFLALTGMVLVGMALHVADPGGFGGDANISSVAQFLLLTGFATLTFAEAVEEDSFFQVVTWAIMLVAIAGILQFSAQFAGLKLFSFTGLIPTPFLFESGYNLEIPVGIGDMLKSNGLLLLEPSIFSQFMALGLIIEAVGRRRVWFLVAFTAGFLVSFSGTGWMVLGAFLLGSIIVMGQRGLLIALGVAALLGTAIAGAAFVAPDVVDAVAGRLDEISRPGTSGFLRFITPYWFLSDALKSDPTAFFIGIGSGASERMTMPYEFNVNTPVKIMVEYGAPVLAAYVTLCVLGRKTRVQAALLLPAMVLFFFAGGYQQFPPIIFTVLLLTAVARLRVAD